MKKLMAGLAITSLLTLCACSYSGDATVENKSHTASHTETGTASNGKYSWATTRQVPEAWTVTIRGADGRTFPVRVEQAQYDSLEKGETVQVDNGRIAD